MLNPQIFTSTPPTQNTTARNDTSATATKPANGAATDPFGAVLARQMQEKKNAAAQPQNTSGSDNSKAAKSTTETATTAANQDQTNNAPPTTDAASLALASMLFGSPAAKAAVTPGNGKEQDKTAPATTPASTGDAATMAAGMFGYQAQPLTSDVNTGKPLRPSGSSAVVQTGIGAGRENPATAAMPKAEAVLQSSMKTGAESFKSAALSASLPSTAPSDQAMAQSASTLVAASLPPDRATTSTANTTISAPLGSSAWPAEFAQKINWVSTQQNQVAELHLNPPDLGPMSVVLSVSDNQATAVFSSPHSAVRDAIENAMPKLRESMAENGITLGNTSVNDQAPRDNGASSFANQQSRNPRSTDIESGGVLPAVSLPAATTRSHNGMVDTFA